MRELLERYVYLRDNCHTFTSDPGEDHLIRGGANTLSDGVDNSIDWSTRILRDRATRANNSVSDEL